MPEQRLAPLDVVREAAARQHHAATGPDPHRPAVALHPGADHRAAFGEQFARRRGQPYRDVEVHRGPRQPTRERIAVGERHAAAVAHHVQQVAPDPPRHVGERLQRAEDPHEVPDLLARAEHHAEDGELRQRRCQLLHPVAQLAAVERTGHHRAAALHAARRLGVVVGKDRRHVELHAGARGEEVDRLGAVVQERIHPFGIEVAAGLVLEVGPGGSTRLGDAELGRKPRPWHPEPAAGAGRRAAEARFLLHHPHVQSVRGRGDGRSHARGAGTDHQHVALQVFRHHVPAPLLPHSCVESTASSCRVRPRYARRISGRAISSAAGPCATMRPSSST